VENTLGKLCTEKKTALAIDESEYVADKKRPKTQTKQLSDRLNNYREWLLSLTVCDPACGSGAFLNAALDFLMTEHRYIDELTAKLFGSGIVFPNIENAILENNLYGVDINEESVEIAKLALWLRTAKPQRKLNSLNNNIKCGNSLISDPEVAGEKAFDWQKEFPQVFEKGGFDVVIGNPPYVNARTMNPKEREYLVKFLALLIKYT
jgi:type I restriction-modification system DNA methylase subunit